MRRVGDGGEGGGCEGILNHWRLERPLLGLRLII